MCVLCFPNVKLFSKECCFAGFFPLFYKMYLCSPVKNQCRSQYFCIKAAYSQHYVLDIVMNNYIKLHVSLILPHKKGERLSLISTEFHLASFGFQSVEFALLSMDRAHQRVVG